jgi:hypothetical protein
VIYLPENRLHKILISTEELLGMASVYHDRSSAIVVKDEIRDWLNDHVGKEYWDFELTLDWWIQGSIFTFVKKDHAMLFKLTWG